MVHAWPMEGGAVPDGLSFGNRTPSFLERLCLGLLSQFRPFHGNWIPMWSRSMVALQLPTVAPAFPSTPSVAEDPIVLVVLRLEAGDKQTASQGTPTE